MRCLRISFSLSSNPWQWAVNILYLFSILREDSNNSMCSMRPPATKCRCAGTWGSNTFIFSQHSFAFGPLISSPRPPPARAPCILQGQTLTATPCDSGLSTASHSHTANLLLALDVAGPSPATHLPLGGKLQSSLAPTVKTSVVQVPPQLCLCWFWWFVWDILLNNLTWKCVSKFFLWTLYLSAGVSYGIMWLQALLINNKYLCKLCPFLRKILFFTSSVSYWMEYTCKAQCMSWAEHDLPPLLLPLENRRDSMLGNWKADKEKEQSFQISCCCSGSVDIHTKLS